MLVRIKEVVPLEKFRVRLSFTDGSKRDVDLRPYLRGPIFDPLLSDPTLFRAVRVDPQLGTIVWPNGADIDPDVLYHRRTPVAWETTPSAVNQ
jgi:hypothetical protein